MYGTMYTNEHVNSSPIGMGTLCSTLCHLPYKTEACAVYSVVLPILQEAVMESDRFPTGEFSLVSVRRYAFMELELLRCC